MHTHNKHTPDPTAFADLRREAWIADLIVAALILGAVVYAAIV